MSQQEQETSIFTTAVHSGHAPPMKGARPHVAPITASVGFVYDAMADTDAALGGGSGDFIYARNAGPTQAAFEEAVATLEGAEAALSFSSGMAALHAAMLTVAHPGGHIVVAEDLYGTTKTLANWLDATMQITPHAADLTDIEATRALIEKVEPTALICEVITNPTVRVIDLPTIAMLVHGVGGQVVVDNTFATPYLMRPLDAGADLVVHSATKFLNGHGDVLAGVLVGPADLCHVAFDTRKLLGATLGPFDAWLALRGMRTLPVRMRQACENAAWVAAWLEEQAGISRVAYPGLANHPDHTIAQGLFRERGYGAMLAFELAGADREKTFAFIEALEICEPVTSLGNLTTLVSHPASASHRSVPAEEREARGITEGLVRMSVGIEDPADLIGDLEQALDAV